MLQSLTLVPTALLRSSRIDVNGTSYSSTISNAEGKAGSGGVECYYAGSMTDEEALDLLRRFQCIVFKDKCSNRIRVGLQVEDEGQIFDLEILNMEGGEVMWQIRGTTFCLGYRQAR
ncbi:hypothetical protein OESDEN_01693 [Oesophagostomum dentatum]|uniref:Uncharacterized protein n=1 Tax=Oesophagostomum dentatum TaxID=61180 RepID=A0A0B1TQD2_OESDE|nr:hypothetical protein OESDEN_01693 [Oesophagostomum dentatum]